MMPNMSDKSLRIAVVEDDVDLLDTTLEYLRAHDCVVWGATSAEEFYRRFAVDAVIWWCSISVCRVRTG